MIELIQYTLPSGVELVPLEDTHINRAAEIHHEAFINNMGGILGIGYSRELIRWWIHNEQAISIAAVEGNELLGFIFGAPSDYYHRINHDLFFTVAKAFFSHPAAWVHGQMRHQLTEKLGLMAGLIRNNPLPVELPPPVMAFVGCGVAIPACGRGIGAALWETLEIETRRRNIAKSARGIVYQKNLVSNHIFEKLGWKWHALARPGYGVWYKIY